jgi:hypothetical protein
VDSQDSNTATDAKVTAEAAQLCWTLTQAIRPAINAATPDEISQFLPERLVVRRLPDTSTASRGVSSRRTSIVDAIATKVIIQTFGAASTTGVSHWSGRKTDNQPKVTAAIVANDDA